MENPFPYFWIVTWDLIKALSGLLVTLAFLSAFIIIIMVGTNNSNAEYDNIDVRIEIEVRYSDAYGNVDAMNEAVELCKKNGFELCSIDDHPHGKNSFVKAVGIKQKEEAAK